MYKKKVRWTATQIEYIKKYAGVLKDEEIAAVLGRTLKSVRLKRLRMGIEKESGHGRCAIKGRAPLNPPAK